ncbi:MAG: ATP-binding protein [Ignavibacteria bacterium]
MDIFKRNLLNKLAEWKSSKFRKPLVLRGARQVGKTTLINSFSKNFIQYIYLNLDDITDKRIFEESAGFDKTIEAIFFLKNADRNQKDTLIFIDEIQNSPVAVNLLRYFYEKTPEICVIAAGSLLEPLIDKHISFPVGRVEYLVLHPFNFEEFLLASGEQNIIDVWNSNDVPDFAHDKLTEMFKIYSLIGGMPDVVKSYITEKNLHLVKNIISNLVTSYKDDVEKYAKNDSKIALIRHLIDNAFYHAGERIKFNGFGNTNYRSREVSEAFRILEKALLLKLIYPTTKAVLPLISDRKKSPKLQLLDTGLVNFSCGIEKDIYQAKDISAIFKGRISEQIVGQELISLNSSPETNLIFWTREKKQSDAEVDFLIKSDDRIIPIEVKSNVKGHLKSLNQFIDETGYDKAVRFYSGKSEVVNAVTNKRKKFRLLNLPYYLCGKIYSILDEKGRGNIVI